MLGLHPIDITSSFFELGGDSLMAALVCVEIERQFGRTLPLSVLVQAPTIRQLADLLDRAAPGGSLVLLGGDSAKLLPAAALLVHRIGGNIVGYGAFAQRLGSRAHPSMACSPGGSADAIPRTPG